MICCKGVRRIVGRHHGVLLPIEEGHEREVRGPTIFNALVSRTGGLLWRVSALDLLFEESYDLPPLFLVGYRRCLHNGVRYDDVGMSQKAVEHQAVPIEFGG
jgi:hypothetical protein